MHALTDVHASVYTLSPASPLASIPPSLTACLDFVPTPQHVPDSFLWGRGVYKTSRDSRVCRGRSQVMHLRRLAWLQYSMWPRTLLCHHWGLVSNGPQKQTNKKKNGFKPDSACRCGVSSARWDPLSCKPLTVPISAAGGQLRPLRFFASFFGPGLHFRKHSLTSQLCPSPGLSRLGWSSQTGRSSFGVEGVDADPCPPGAGQPPPRVLGSADGS